MVGDQRLPDFLRIKRHGHVGIHPALGGDRWASAGGAFVCLENILTLKRSLLVDPLCR